MTVPMIFVAAAWGPDYVRRWLDWSLPTLLAPGNLPAVSPAKVIVVTRTADAETMAQHPAFRALRDLCPVEFVHLDLPTDGAARDHMTRAHDAGLRVAKQAGGDPAICFLNADMIASDGLYRTVAGHLARGRRAVLAQGFQVEEEKFVAGLPKAATLSLSPPEILSRAKAATDNWDTLPRWRAPFPAHPSQLFWPSDDGLLLHCWHLSPLAIRTGDIDTLTGTVDNDLTERCCAFEDAAILQDASEGCLVSIEDNPTKAWGGRNGPPSVERIVRWAFGCSPMQRRFFSVPVRFGRVDPETEALASETVSSILHYRERTAALATPTLPPRALFITTRTNEVDGHVAAWDSVAPMPSERITFDPSAIRNDWVFTQKALEMRPDIIFYIGAHRAPGNPIPSTLQELRRIAPFVSLVSDAADYPWHPVIKAYRERGCFDMQVSIDGANCSPVDFATLTPVDTRRFAGPDAEKDIRFGFSGSVGRWSTRSEIVRALTWFGGLTVRARDVNGDGYADHVAFLKRTKILLNVSLTGTQELNHIKGRVLEAGWAKCCLLEDENSPIHEWFPKDCYFRYRDPKHAAEIAASLTDKEISHAAARLHEEVRDRFSPNRIYGDIVERARIARQAFVAASQQKPAA